MTTPAREAMARGIDPCAFDENTNLPIALRYELQERRKEAYEQADAAIFTAEAAGYVLVPVEATEAQAISALTRALDEARAEIEWHKAKSAERHETEAGYLRAIREARANALEEAAGICDDIVRRYGTHPGAEQCAAAIRAAKEQP